MLDVNTRRQAEIAFGVARGWRLADTEFRLRDLQLRLKPGNWRPLALGLGWPREFLDHPVFYRDGDRRAVAVLAQPYDDDGRYDRGGALRWAAEAGVLLSFPDAPSWWCAGRTILVLAEPSTQAADGRKSATETAV